eukprot:363729-Chlamydomonas_euryale.AAC.5
MPRLKGARALRWRILAVPIVAVRASAEDMLQLPSLVALQGWPRWEMHGLPPRNGEGSSGGNASHELSGARAWTKHLFNNSYVLTARTYTGIEVWALTASQWFAYAAVCHSF